MQTINGRRLTVMAVMVLALAMIAGIGPARAADDGDTPLFNSAHTQPGAAPLFLDRGAGSAGAAAQGGRATVPYNFNSGAGTSTSRRESGPSLADNTKAVKADNAARAAAAAETRRRNAAAITAKNKAALLQRTAARRAAHPHTTPAAQTQPQSRPAARPQSDSRPAIYNGGQQNQTSHGPLFLQQ